MFTIYALQAAYRSALQVRKLVTKGKGKSHGLASSSVLSLWLLTVGINCEN